MRRIDKKFLLTSVFADESDPRIGFFCEQMTYSQMKALIDLRSMVLEEGEVEPYALGDYQLRLSAKTINSGSRYSPSEKLPVEGTEAFIALYNLIVRSKSEVANRSLWRSGKLQRAKVPRSEGLTLPAVILGVTVLVYAMWFNTVLESDRAISAQFESNVNQGLCVEKEATCTGPSGGIGGLREYSCLKHFPTQDGVDCTQAGSGLLLLTMAALLVGLLAYCRYESAQHTSLFRSMQTTCDDPKFDSLLNEVLLKRGKPINWSSQVRVEGKLCSLRKATLIALLCFDDRMYKDLSSYVEQLQSDDDASLSFPSSFMEPPAGQAMGMKKA